MRILLGGGDHHADKVTDLLKGRIELELLALHLITQHFHKIAHRLVEGTQCWASGSLSFGISAGMAIGRLDGLVHWN
ncbi:hypothetical protein D3C71_1773820 [compost metagenome]